MSTQELELRGPLTKKEFVDLNKFMQKNAKYLRDFKRLQFLYYNDEQLKKQPGYVHRDFRIRVENRNPTLTMKYGDWRKGNAREEMHIPFLLEDLDEMVRLLTILGYKKGRFILQETSIYLFEEIEWALVKIPGVGKDYYYFEAEVSGENLNVEKEKTKLMKSISKLKLKVFEDEEFSKFCTTLDNIEGRQFDFGKDQWENFKMQFNDYI